MLLYCSGENAELKDSREELSRLRRENTILSRRLHTALQGSTNSEDDSQEREKGGASGACVKLEPASKSKKGKKRDEGGSSYGGSVLTVSSSSDGFETVTMSPDERGESLVT